jgi:lipopolysaccharide biosynthesis glycosyltransferase
MQTAVSNVTTVHALVCHRDLLSAITCLGSLLYYSSDPLRIVLHDDGSLSGQEKAHLKSHLGAEMISRLDADQLMDERLKPYPNATKFRRSNVLALKLLDVALLSGSQDVAYCDSDVLFFRPFSGLFRWPDTKTSALFVRDFQNAYSLYPWHLRQTPLLDQVNTGLYFVRAKTFDLGYVEWLLGRSWTGHIPYWVEQTCWAALGARMNCHMWSTTQVNVSCGKRIDHEGSVACHFAGATKRFIEAAAHSGRRCSTEIVEIATVTARRTGAVRLLRSHFRRKSKALFAVR